MGQTLTGAAARRPMHHRRTTGWPPPPSPHEPITVSEQGVGVPRRQEVEFADGTKIWLLRVDQQGVPQLFVRDLGAPATAVRIDLRHLVPELATDLPRAATRDVPGVVHFSLRGRFKSLDEFLQIAVSSGRPS